MTIGKVMILFCVAMSIILTLLPHLIWLLGWCGGRVFGYTISYAPFGRSAVVIVAIFLALMAYGYFIGRWRLTVTEMEYTHNDIPTAFDGFRIAHISDLHLSTFDDKPQQLERFVRAVNSLNPDIICFTGDLVTVGKEEAEPYKKILLNLQAKYGVVSVLGNHDFLLYNQSLVNEEQRYKAVEELATFQSQTLSWKLLRNEHYEVVTEDGSKITLIGVDNKNCTNQGFQTIDKGDLDKAMDGVEGFTILLSHDPTHWRYEVLPQTDIPLTLSGHTHKAQVEIFGWTPARLMFKEVGGMYREVDQSLYVNAGLGCTAPFRIGARPEITLLTLKGTVKN